MKEIIFFGGGCFWCTEAVFKSIRGVMEVTPGYAGGDMINPDYEHVSSGNTGHAEVIRVDFDSEKISLKNLLEVFFATHDPTTKDRQGNDIGHQYRSIILYASKSQENEILNFISAYDGKKIYSEPILTEVKELENFYPAEDYHKDYYDKHRQAPYCQLVINPKLTKLRKQFGALLREN